LPECLHLKAVDLVDDSVELVLEFRGGLDVYAAGQHQIDRAIEVSAGGEKITLLVVGLPRRVCLVDLLDKSPHPLLLSGRLRRGNRSLCRLLRRNRFGQGWSEGLRRRRGHDGCALLRSAP